MSTELVVGTVTPAPATTPNDLLAIAIGKGASLEQMERLMDMQIKWEAHEAKKAFYAAKAAFKAEAPTVIKDKQNLQYKSMYASEAALLGAVNPILSKHGLDAHFEFPAPSEPTTVSVSGVLAHALGHSERVTLEGPVDTSGAKNPLQQVKSTVTYLRKATFEAITGVASGDSESDDDGNGAGQNQFISEKQHNTIVDMIVSTGSDESKFCAHFKIPDVANLPESKFGQAMTLLNKKAKK